MDKDRLYAKILAIPELDVWPGLRDVLSVHKDGTLLLLEMGRRTAGGRAPILPVQAAFLCTLVCCIVIDDIIDEDTKGAYLTMGAGRASNLGVTLQTAAFAILQEAPYPPKVRAALLRALTTMVLRHGRVKDIETRPITSEEDFWDVVGGKSGQVCGTALMMGGIVGGGSPALLRRLYAAGRLIGEVGQVSNDLKGAFRVPANTDWREPGQNLALLFAATGKHPYRKEFLKVRAKAQRSRAALKRGQELLIECGAVGYCFYSIVSRLRALKRCLSGMPPEQSRRIRGLLRPEIAHAAAWLEKNRLVLPDEALAELRL